MVYDTVLILGGGGHGTKALRALTNKSKKIIVVDKNPSCRASKFLRLACGDPSRCDINFRLVVDDATHYLLKLMKTGNPPDLIVPTAPGNTMARLFFEWLSDLGLRLEADKAVLEKALAEIPKEAVLQVDRSTATIIVSYARDFLCAPRCREPEICPITGKKYQEPLHKVLSRLCLCTYNKIFRSELVAESVGAIDGKETYHELTALPRNPEGYTFCIGTACRCHGIINFFRTFNPNQVN